MEQGEKARILAVMDKYEDYFKEWDADVLFGNRGPHFFYLYSKRYGYFEVFHSFETAEQLELIIAGTLAENLETMNSVCAEELQFAFREIDVSEVINEYEPKFHMHILEKQLEAMAKQSEQWLEMMTKTYKALSKIIREQEK